MKIDELSQVLDRIIKRDSIKKFDLIWASWFKRSDERSWCNGTLRPAPGGMIYQDVNGEDQMVKLTDDLTILLRFPDVKSWFDRTYADVFLWKKIIVLLDEVRAESAIPGTISAEALQAVNLLAKIKALLE